MRLFPEIKWVNSMQDGTMARVRQPVLLAPVAGLLRDRLGEAVITPSSMRSILDSVGNRLDEAKDTSRYLTGLLVFLGLLGTFYGLLETVTHVAAPSNALDTIDRRHGERCSPISSRVSPRRWRHGHGVLGLAARPHRFADPRLPRSAGRARRRMRSTPISRTG